MWEKGNPLTLLGFPDSSVGKESACNAEDPGLIPGSGRSAGEGIDYPLQYSGLENSMDCIVHGVAKSQTHLKKKEKESGWTRVGEVEGTGRVRSWIHLQWSWHEQFRLVKGVREREESRLMLKLLAWVTNWEAGMAIPVFNHLNFEKFIWRPRVEVRKENGLRNGPGYR